MSYQIEYTGKIKKDIKLAVKRGLNLDLFKNVIILLEKDGKLPSKYKPHLLKEILLVIGNVISSQIGS